MYFGVICPSFQIEFDFKEHSLIEFTVERTSPSFNIDMITSGV
jgi:hypothetical protein